MNNIKVSLTLEQFEFISDAIDKIDPDSDEYVHYDISTIEGVQEIFRDDNINSIKNGRTIHEYDGIKVEEE